MASDNSIPLQVNQPSNPLAQIGQYASAAASLQNVQNMKAALPGIQADSQIKQRAAAFNDWLTNNASKYIKPDETGGKNHNVDYSGLVAAAANAGFVTEAQGVAANDLKNQSQMYQNGLTQASTANTEAATKGTMINNANNANNLAITTRGYVSTLMDAYVKANPNAPQYMLDKEYNKVVKGVQDQYGTALNVKGVFGDPDQLVGIDPNTKQPQMSYRYDPVENKAMLTATMSPQVQQELANSREVINQAGATGQSSAAYRDPNSQETAAARQIAIATDPAHADVYKTMTGAQLAANTIVGGAVMANINPAGARVSAVADGVQHINNAKQYANAADALDALKAKFSSDLTFNQMGPLAWIQNNLNKFANDPTFVTAQTMLQNVNQTHPELKLSSMDAGSASAALRAQQNNSLSMAGTSLSVATAPTSSSAAAGVATQGGKPGATPQNPTGTGSVKMKDQRGKTYNIPRDKVAAAKADGLTVVQ